MDESEPHPVVLSVDDQEGDRYIRDRVLRGAGFAVIDAADGATALRLAAERRPSLIVLDIRLADIDGFEVCRRLKADPGTKDIPVLHVSAAGQFEHDLPQSLEHRPDAYLREPIEAATLVATAQALIRAAEAGRRQHQAEERARQAERQITDVLESLADPVTAFDRQWRYTYVSRRAAELLGKRQEEIVGKTVWDVFPAGIDSAFQEACEQAWRDNRPVSVASYSKALDIWVESHIYPSENGATVQWRDVTGRKRAEEALRESEEALRKSEARLSTALDHLVEGVLIATEAGRMIYWNPATLAMHGFADVQEVPGALEDISKTFQLWTADGARLLPSEEWPMPRIMRGEVVRGLELRLRRPDRGWERFISHSGATLDTGSGERLIYLSLYDLTEQRHAEQALRDSEQRYRALFQSMQEAFAVAEIVCSPSGEPVDWRYLDVNPAFESMFAKKREEVVGRTFREIFPDAPWEYWVPHLGRVALTGEPAHLDHFGPEYGRHYEATAYSPRPGQFAAVFADVTGRKRAEERLRQTQKLESIGVLAGGIAHDFNNLLTGIMGNASLVLDEVGAGPAARIREVIGGAERAANLTQQLLAYSGKGQFVVRDVDVSEAIHEIAGLVEFSIPKSVEIAVTVQRRLPVVRMDPSQLQQVLMNLVINAGEAIGEGRPGKITVTTSGADIGEPFIDAVGEDVAPGRYVSIEVADTGAGLDEETKSRIFEPFFTTKFTGRGLGLAAVAGIVRSQKGAITVESTPGWGTAFRVLLPVAGPRAREAGGLVPSGARGAVLVVDDEATVRDFIAAVLRKQGYRVLEAADGRDALAAYNRENGEVDAVILDVVMPVMGGNELLPELKARQPELKILLTSGYSESEARRLCAAYPGAAFIQKPYTAQQITKAVEELLRSGSGPRPRR